METHAQTLLHQNFGYDKFRGDQEAIIQAATDGQDTLVLMPTGGGKSICYQIAGMMRPGLTIVVSPLIALMEDQVSALIQNGIEAAFLNSSQNTNDQKDVLARIANGALKMLYIAPERLVQSYTLSRLANTQLGLIAIDEAHCVSQWGHDFRQDYLSLNLLKETFPDTPRMALTATATPATQAEIVERLELTQPRIFISSFDRPNIRYTVKAKTDGRAQLKVFLSGHHSESGIIYCLSRNKVEQTADWLSKQGFKALLYHAGLSPEIRTQNQRRFLREDGIIMVATIAFGMGIDKPDVRFVAHLDLPKSVESYYQETGRAGRDGKPAEAWMVYGLQDVVHLSKMVDQSEADMTFKRREKQKLDALLGWCEVTGCRRQALLAYFNETADKPCGNCDTCLNPPKRWDATICAQKLLSCIYRSGQRFGVGHIIDILNGKQTEKVRQNNHDKLSTFGLGQDINTHQWRSITRQLLTQGFIIADHDRYGALRLAEKSRPLLRNEIKLQLREDARDTNLPTTRNRAESKKAILLANKDQALLQALRQCRKKLSDEQNVPPYVIFHDSTLIEMAQFRPEDSASLLDITGVGETKLARYGNAFLAVIRDYRGA